ncbi:MAG: class I SAM-dependent methyltransferase [Nitrospirota bacterium]
MIGSILFTWMQGAHFYQELHREAVETVPSGEGKRWVDVGCGPGLVSRIAVARGYKVTGIDMDPRMIKAAKHIGRHQKSPAMFEVGNVFSLPENIADVVSAASLLAVIDDKHRCLQSLWGCVRQGGYLLIIEPTEKMNPDHAKRIIGSNLSSKRIQGLKLWAAARKNRAVDPEIFKSLQSKSLKYVELLEGLVGAWLLAKY